jgi:CMP-N-acetylneuraminic acid synthetase
MIQGKKVLGVIPARSGSRKVSQKYLRSVAGHSVLGWTIRAAQKSQFIDQLILSSDDLLIIQEAKNYGCDVPFLRPKHLARPGISVVSAILHAVEMTPGYDFVAVLQPSSPLRTTEDIDRCIAACLDSQAPACVSETEPSYGACNAFTLDAYNRLVPTVPGQFVNHRHDGYKCYVPNGAVCVAEIAWLQREKDFLSAQTA